MLLSQADKVGETVINARDYIYDEVGNITNITASNGTDISNLTSAEMAYDAANRLIKYNGEEVKYDADGNMIYGPLNGEMSEFVYDCRNRLVSAGGVTYEYDAENNRISKTAGETNPNSSLRGGLYMEGTAYPPPAKGNRLMNPLSKCNCQSNSTFPGN